MIRTIELGIFSDINQTMTSELVFDESSVFQALFNLLSTVKKERVFLPTYGTNIVNYLHRLMDKSLDYLIFNEILDAIDKWEPRVEVDYRNSKVELFHSTHEIIVYLEFKIKNLTGNYYMKVDYSQSKFIKGLSYGKSN